MRRGVWMVLVSFVSACPAVKVTPDASTSEQPPQDVATAYCNTLAAADCAWALRCGIQSQLACPLVWEDCAAQARPLLAVGAVTFNADAGATCIAAMEQQSCDYQRPNYKPAPCDDVFVGTALEGERCGTCAAGLECDYLSGSGSCGTCQPRARRPLPGLGQSCNGGVCAESLACTGLTCAPFGGFGAACSSGTCAPGLVCPVSRSNPTCERLSDLGESCASAIHCKYGLRCEAGVCVALLERDAACTNSHECLEGYCLRDTCVQVVFPLGGSCREGLCASGLACDQEGVCVSAKAAGSACNDDICEIGSSCVDGVCFSRTLSCQ